MSAPPRLFVALAVPEHVRVLVDAARAPARDAAPGASWTRPDGWHVTLAYLGELDRDLLGAAEEVVGGACAEVAPLRLTLGTPDRFGDRVLWLGVHDDPAGAVADLGRRMQARIAASGLPVQQREVRPHLTLARASRRTRGALDETVRDAVAPVEVTWDAEEVVLLATRLGDGPARYEPVASWTLGGPVDDPPAAAPSG